MKVLLVLALLAVVALMVQGRVHSKVNELSAPSREYVPVEYVSDLAAVEVDAEAESTADLEGENEIEGEAEGEVENEIEAFASQEAESASEIENVNEATEEIQKPDTSKMLAEEDRSEMAEMAMMEAGGVKDTFRKVANKFRKGYNKVKRGYNKVKRGIQKIKQVFRKSPRKSSPPPKCTKGCNLNKVYVAQKGDEPTYFPPAWPGINPPLFSLPPGVLPYNERKWQNAATVEYAPSDFQYDNFEVDAAALREIDDPVSLKYRADREESNRFHKLLSSSDNLVGETARMNAAANAVTTPLIYYIRKAPLELD